MQDSPSLPPSQADTISLWLPIVAAVAWICRVTGCSWALAIKRLHRALVDGEIRSMERHRVADQWIQNSLTADFWFDWELQAKKDNNNLDSVNLHWLHRHRRPSVPPVCYFFVARADLEERWPDKDEPTTAVRLAPIEEKTAEPTAEPATTEIRPPIDRRPNRPPSGNYVRTHLLRILCDLAEKGTVQVGEEGHDRILREKMEERYVGERRGHPDKGRRRRHTLDRAIKDYRNGWRVDLDQRVFHKDDGPPPRR